MFEFILSDKKHVLSHHLIIALPGYCLAAMMTVIHFPVIPTNKIALCQDRGVTFDFHVLYFFAILGSLMCTADFPYRIVPSR